MEFGKLIDKAKDAADKAKETAKRAKDQAAEYIDIGKEKLQEAAKTVMEETVALMKILQNSGYVVGDISMTVSIPPKARLSIQDTGNGQANLEAILDDEDAGLSKLQSGAIHTILKAYDLASVTDDYGYTFGKKFDLTVTLPPQVTLHLSYDK